MGAHITQLRTRGSSSSNTFSRPGFKLYWMVRQASGAYVSGWPGDEAYSGIGWAPTLGIHSRTVQATVQSDWNSAWASGVNFQNARCVIADWEGGGESGSDMQNILTWLRSAVNYNGIPLGIYGGNPCAMNKQVNSLTTWTPGLLATKSTANDGMKSAVQGTGNAACQIIAPELYFNGRGERAVCEIKWFASEYTRMGLTNILMPMLNPKYPPGRPYAGNLVPGRYWRGVLEAAIRTPQISAIHIWHADRGTAWDANEDWFRETLSFISTYGLTTGNLW